MMFAQRFPATCSTWGAKLVKLQIEKLAIVDLVNSHLQLAFLRRFLSAAMYVYVYMYVCKCVFLCDCVGESISVVNSANMFVQAVAKRARVDLLLLLL